MFDRKPLNRGDIIWLTSTPNDHWDTSMRRFKGCMGEVNQLSSDRWMQFTIKECSGVFRYADIDRDATQEDVTLLEEEKIKKLKSLVYKRDDVARVAREIFPEERIDIAGTETQHTLTIHFPELTLTNTTGRKHTIKDLYVSFYISLLRDKPESEEMLANIEFKGARTTVSLAEFQSSYIHSHLSRGNSCTFSSFCTGSSDYNMLLTELRMSLTEDGWRMVFLSLENYLKWESLEGGPHVKIENITKGSRVEMPTLQREAERLLPYCPRNIYTLVEGIPKIIKGHPSFVKFLDENCRVRTMHQSDPKTDKKLVKGAITAFKRNGHINWRGTPVKCNVYLEEDPKNDEKLPVHPEIVDTIEYFIDSKFSEFLKTIQHEREKRKYQDLVFGPDAIYANLGEGGANK